MAKFHSFLWLSSIPLSVCVCVCVCVCVYFGRHVSCGILVPQPGIEPGATAVKALSHNNWTAREVSRLLDFLMVETSLMSSP